MNRNQSHQADMEFVDIPGTSIRASRVALGTWAIGGWMWGGSNESDAISAIQAALDRGINLIDTAPVYGFGRSEEIVGKALAAGWPAQACIHRHQGWARLERRQTVSQRQQGADHQGSRGFPASSADRCHRSLPGPLAGPEHADRGSRRRHGRAAPRRKNPRHRRQQFQPGPDGRISQGSAAARGSAALQPVRTRHRRRRASLLSRARHRVAGLWLAMPGAVVGQHVQIEPLHRRRPAQKRSEISSRRASNNILPRSRDWTSSRRNITAGG